MQIWFSRLLVRGSQMLQIFSGRIDGRIPALLWVALSLAFFGCSTMSVRSEYDRKIEFSRYRIFSWVGARDRPKPPPEWLDKLVRETVEQELVAKGYQKADGKEPDFLVAYDAAIEERTVWQPVFPGAGVPSPGTPSINPSSPVWWPFFSGTGTVTVCPYVFREGTLLIDFFDASSERLAWRGCAVDVVGNRSEAQKKIQTAVKRLLQRFPPKQ